MKKPPKTGFTDDYLGSITPQNVDSKVEMQDTQVRHLYIRVSRSAGFVWFVSFMHDKKRVKRNIGTWPEMNVGNARLVSLTIREEVRQEISEIDKVQVRKALVGDYLDRYIKSVGPLMEPRSLSERKRHIEKWMRPHWSDQDIRSIKESDVLDLLAAQRQSAQDRGRDGDRAVEALYTAITAFFNWAAGRSTDYDTPENLIIPGLYPPYKPKKKARQKMRGKARTRMLTNIEIRELWDNLPRLGWPLEPMAKLLLLTGVRKGELEGMRWEEIDLERKVWRIPAERMKARTAHTVMLSRQAVEILSNLKKVDGSAFVFPSPTDSGKHRTIHAKDRNKIYGACSTSGWTLHDFRRTVSTMLRQERVLPHICEMILAHSGQGKIAAVYNQYDYEQERQDAMQLWADMIDDIVRGPTGGNVVPIRDVVTA